MFARGGGGSSVHHALLLKLTEESYVHNPGGF